MQEVEGGVAEGGQEQGSVPPSGSSDSDGVDNNAQDCHGAFNVDADEVDMNAVSTTPLLFQCYYLKVVKK